MKITYVSKSIWIMSIVSTLLLSSCNFLRKENNVENVIQYESSRACEEENTTDLYQEELNTSESWYEYFETEEVDSTLEDMENVTSSSEENPNTSKPAKENQYETTKSEEFKETEDNTPIVQPEINQPQVPETEVTIELPWDNGGKQPSEYTWKEYLALTDDQKLAFFETFESQDKFDEWLKQAQKNELPWEIDGKQPSEYTWDEYQALSPEEKDAFFDTFESIEEFDRWMKWAQNGGVKWPWETGGKQPSEYTWDEYQALSPEEKDAFFDTFESLEEFDRWMKWAQNGGVKWPWETGGKQPSEYTWEEYQALSSEEKDAFFESFESVEAFNQWMKYARENGEKWPWETGGKQPSEYTWEEYQALSSEEKDAFFESFESVEAFNQWMKYARENGKKWPWETGGKQPSEYTWDEYQALSPEEKDAFFESFDDIDAFLRWLAENQP